MMFGSTALPLARVLEYWLPNVVLDGLLYRGDEAPSSEEGKKMQDLIYLGTLYEDLVLPFAGVIIVVGLLAAAIIHWRFK